MPTYDYLCEKCNTVVEEFHGMNEKPKISCPDCNKSMRRLISTSGFILKGGGWYKDGYSNHSNKGRDSTQEIRDKTRHIGKEAKDGLEKKRDMSMPESKPAKD